MYPPYFSRKSRRQKLEGASRGSFVEHFSSLKDPRVERHKLYPLIEILFLVLCGSICGVEGWRDYVLFGESKLEFLRQYFPYKNGIPSKSTLSLIFSLMNPSEFKRCFISWIQSLQASLEDIIAVDGKSVRHSFDKAAEQSAIHMVSAFSARMKLVLAQEKVEDKSNEITAIPKLLQLLELHGAIVTIDAMGCQTKIANQIIDQGGDYILGLKGNQETLHKDVELFLETEISKENSTAITDYFEEIDFGHGRIEERKCYVSDQVEWLPQYKKWKGLRSIIMIEAKREKKAGKCNAESNNTDEKNSAKKSSIERRYYISSLSANAEKISRAVRAHWSIENQLHWVLDVTFNEDASRVRKDHAPENMSMVRHIVLNMISKAKNVYKKVSIRGLRKKAGWDDKTLTTILQQHF